MGKKKNAAAKLFAAEAAPDVTATPMTADAMDPVQSKEAPSKPLSTPTPKKTELFSIELLLAALAAVLSALLVTGETYNNALVLPAFLLISCCLLLGGTAIKELVSDVVAGRETSMHVPLTNATLTNDTINKFANSCQVREKGLKILQYVLRAGAYWKPIPSIAKDLKKLSKTTSIARRFFKFCRWVKHFEDLAEAKEETVLYMRTLLYIRVAANFGADWAEDVCSLERIGVLPAGTLSVGFMLFAEYCQLVLALVEISVTAVKAQKDAAKTSKKLADAATTPKEATSLKRKLAMTRLELIKYVSDIGKATFDCELRFSHESVFIGCSLFSALLSTHKNMFKVLK